MLKSGTIQTEEKFECNSEGRQKCRRHERTARSKTGQQLGTKKKAKSERNTNSI
jgi:hypothetical protein